MMQLRYKTVWFLLIGHFVQPYKIRIEKRNVRNLIRPRYIVGAIFPQIKSPDDHPEHEYGSADLLSSFDDSSPENKNDRDFEYRSKLAFEFAVYSLNQLYAANRTFTTTTMSYLHGLQEEFQITKKVCSQLYIGVAAIVSSTNSKSIQSACNAKHMAHMYIGKSERSIADISKKKFLKHMETIYTLKLTPSIDMWNKAVFDLALHFRWMKVAILYCGDLSRVQPLVDALSKIHNAEVTLLRVKPNDRLQLKTTLNIIQERRIKRIAVDCEDYNSLFLFLNQALESNLLEKDYHYILFGANSPRLLESHARTFGKRNITAFDLYDDRTQYIRQLVRTHWKKFLSNRLPKEVASKSAKSGSLPLSSFTMEVALMFDALSMYAATLYKLMSNKLLRFNHRSIPCDSNSVWLFGQTLIRALKNSSYPGLTGRIYFDENGERSKVQFNVVTPSYTSLDKIGEWSSEGKRKSRSGKYETNSGDAKRLTMFDAPTSKSIPAFSNTSLNNRSLVVTTIVVDPYVFKETILLDKEEKVKFSGYCIDLLNILSEELKFIYNLTEVPDKAYGSRNDEDGSWNGMIGELKKGHADLAVAPLTITYDREKAVRFTKPYMSLGVGILYQTPKVGSPSLFGFLNPLSPYIWVLVIVSYVSVALIMFCIARLSPYEWQDISTDEAEPDKVENNFGILDSLWFGIGALMQQGSDISPKSISTRLLAGVWWFFILILISSYTANLAAFLTVTRMETEITNVDDLASQTTIKYGTLDGQATASFFKNSKLPTYAKMWQFMNQSPGVFVKNDVDGISRVLLGGYAYLMESSTLEYVANQHCNLTQVGGLLDSRGYGIATMESNLRDELSVAILKLQENGILDKLKHKWWKGDLECPKEDTSSTQSLTVANLGGAFLFLCIGAAVAVLTAIVEFCVHSFVNARSKKKNLRSEIKLGLATICVCGTKVSKAPFFEKTTEMIDKSSTTEYSSVCCNCMSKNRTEVCCKQHPFTVCDAANSTEQQHSKRYCKHFTAMVETVLNDNTTDKSHGNLSIPTECMTSSLSSSYHPDSTAWSAMSRRASRQVFSPTFGSDIAGSSLSLPGCSPCPATSRIGEYVKEAVVPKIEACKVNRSQLKREDSATRRWKFANGKSFHFKSELQGQYPEEYHAESHQIPLYPDENVNEEKSNDKTATLDLHSLRQTIM